MAGGGEGALVDVSGGRRVEWRDVSASRGVIDRGKGVGHGHPAMARGSCVPLPNGRRRAGDR